MNKTGNTKNSQKNTSYSNLQGFSIPQYNILTESKLHEREISSMESHVNKMISLLIFLMLR